MAINDIHLKSDSFSIYFAKHIFFYPKQVSHLKTAATPEGETVDIHGVKRLTDSLFTSRVTRSKFKHIKLSLTILQLPQKW